MAISASWSEGETDPDAEMGVLEGGGREFLGGQVGRS